MDWRKQFRNSLNTLLTMVAWWSILMPPAMMTDWIIGWRFIPVLSLGITTGFAPMVLLLSLVAFFDDLETLPSLFRGGYKYNIVTVYLIAPASYLMKRAGRGHSLLAA